MRPDAGLATLRPYQSSAVEQARENGRAGVLRQIIYSPTGSGKTEIAIALIHSANSKGRRVAFVANRIGLVEQAARRLRESGLSVGVLQGDNTHRLDAPVLVCSIHTVARRGLPVDIDVIVIDEAHGVAGSSHYRDLLFRYNALPVIGLSATPFAKGLGKHYDKLGGALFERIVQAASIRELIDMGFLVDCDIYAPTEPDLSGVAMVRNAFGEQDYNERQLAAAVDKPSLVGDIVAHWRRLARDLPTVCFATSIAHSKHIASEFNAAGISAEHIDCYTDEEERRGILARVTSGQTRVISNVGILAEGWDMPACGVMILARPTRSLTRWIQMAGRVLRPYPRKGRAIILDHSGSAARLGYPTDDLPLELDDGAAKKPGAGKEKEEPKPKKCPSCSYMKPARVHTCPACGLAPERPSEVEVEPGELVRLKRDRKPTREEKQAFYSQLLELSVDEKWSPHRAACVYRDKFGVYPKGLEKVPEPATQEVRNFVTSRQIAYINAKRKEAGNAAARP
ncbi:DEAD/DEAH box helicase [Thiobacillus denitrificans]|uniref:Helicase n=1 Tax=Thiobacillus denitrificans TaxID=36861 RepID=A0A119CUP2_THIDE|nr:DEAD/DEAH box helicase [Thiobacillus denitrificans]KVW93331.1 helicase [Thiobacillus denitrificans]